MRYLGIDGGGSKTTFLLTDEQEQEIFRVQTGPSNQLSVGQAAARDAIHRGFAQLPMPPDVISAGFAGAGRPESVAFYQEVLTSAAPSASIIVQSDAFIALIGAIGMDPGILLIAGTGSIVMGRDRQGSIFRMGGWGPHFGDEGSGFWIGREAVRALLQRFDDAGPSDLSNRLARQLSLAAVTDIVPAWAAGRIGVPEIAGLTPAVLASYPSEPAKAILLEAAAHLRFLAQRAAKRVGEPCRRCLTGSVATHPIVRELIGFDFQEPYRAPEWGAIIWARHQDRTSNP